MPITRRFRLGLALFGIGLFIVPASGFAADPVAEVLRLTPPDTSLGLFVRDLRAHHAAVTSGPFLEAFRRTTVGKGMAGAPELAKVDEFARQLAQALGMDLSELRNDVFGDAVVFAYRNAGPEGAGQESAVIITWARNAKTAARMLDRLNEAQKKSGELQDLASLMHAGRTFYHRIKHTGKGPDEYYYQKDSVVAFSQQAHAIRAVIDRDRDAPRGGTPPALARHATGNAFATLWLDPRSFDADLAVKLKSADGGEAAFLKTFQQIWKATDGIALTLRLEKHLEANLSLVTRTDDLPPALRRFAAAVKEPSALAGLFPSDALLAVSGRFDVAATLDILTEFMTPEARQSLKGSLEQSLGSVFGKSDVPQLPGRLGPDWGFCVTAPPADSKAVLPEFVAALRVRPGKEAGKVEQSFLDAMDTVAALARVAYNAEHPKPLRRAKGQFGETEVVYLMGEGLPPGFQPAYALKDEFLFIATSPAAIGRLGRIKGEPADDRLAWASFRRLDRYLEQRADGLKQFITSQNKTTVEEAERQIAQLRAGLEMLDRLELVNESREAGQTKLTLRLHFTTPLRK